MEKKNDYLIVRACSIEDAQNYIDSYAADGWIVKTMGNIFDGVGYYILLERTI